MNNVENLRYHYLMRKVLGHLDDKYAEYLSKPGVKENILETVYSNYTDTSDEKIDRIILLNETEKLIKNTVVPQSLKLQ